MRDLRLATALRSTSGGGTLDLRGTLALRGKRTRYDLVAVADALDASALTTRAPSTSITGTIAARGSGFSPATASAAERADLTSSHYDTIAVDRLSTRLAVANGLARVDTLTVLARGARVDASGTLGLVAGQDGTLRFTLTNTGSVHVVPQSIKVRGLAGSNTAFDRDLDGWYVLAGGRREFDTTVPKNACAQVTSIVVDIQFATGKLQERLQTPNGVCPR